MGAADEGDAVETGDQFARPDPGFSRFFHFVRREKSTRYCVNGDLEAQYLVAVPESPSDPNSRICAQNVHSFYTGLSVKKVKIERNANAERPARTCPDLGIRL